MKAVVFHSKGDIRLEEVADPKVEQPTDAIVRLTASAICGTDLHFVRGSFSGMQPGTILGLEGVGIVEEVGGLVRNLRPGDRVVIGSTKPTLLTVFTVSASLEIAGRVSGGLGVNRRSNITSRMTHMRFGPCILVGDYGPGAPLVALMTVNFMRVLHRIAGGL